MNSMEWDDISEEDVQGLPVFDVQGREVGSVVHWSRGRGEEAARCDLAVPGLPSALPLTLGRDDVQFQGDGVHLSRGLEALAAESDVPLDDAVEWRLGEDAPNRGDTAPP